METLERKILIQGRKTLKNSMASASKWKGNKGNFDEWYKYALDMRSAISHFLEITEPLTNEDVELSKDTIEPTNIPVESHEPPKPPADRILHGR